MSRKTYEIKDKLNEEIRRWQERLHRASEADTARFLMSIGIDVLTAVEQGKTIKFDKKKYDPFWRPK